VTACRSRQSSVIELDEIWRLSSEPLPWQVGSGRSNVSFRDFFGFFSEVFGICSEFFRIKPLLSHPDYRIYQTSVFGIFSDFFRKFSESQNRRVISITTSTCIFEKSCVKRVFSCLRASRVATTAPIAPVREYIL
jgi:hypothetical protein